MPLKALTYFEDIDFKESVVMLNHAFDWTEISARLMDMANSPNKIFPEPFST